ncbi:MAG TPA: cache domain-containing protein, partial [bacterium]|nr:cache domain-containing protein [bacterium]
MKGQQIARSFGNLGLRGDRWWFKHFINNNNQPFFSKSYYSLTGNKPVISIFHPVVHNDTTIGILGLDINFDEIQKYIEKNLSDTNMYAIVVDNEGIIIAHPQRQYLQEIHNIRTLVKERLIFTPDGKPVFDLNRNHKTQKLSFNWDKQISICADNAAAGNSGYLANAKIENTNNFIFYTPINFSINTDNGKKYVVLLIRSADSIYYKQNFYIVLTLSISILLSIIAYLLCKRIIEKKIINPILKLTEYMNAYQANGYSQNNIEIEENNELKYMLVAFKNMISVIE